MKAMKAILAVTAYAAVLLCAQPSFAWCDFTDAINGWDDEDGDGDYDPQVPYNSVMVFEIEDNFG